ncbi:MAG: phosphoribulokinase [candidate division WOR-3 bacterium]|nr:phosphoribulokinase [candidate division WOR-3 bacterium]
MKAFLVGVAGDSGSGKSTFAQGIRHLFGKNQVAAISLDDYHLLDRQERKRAGIVALDPRANDLRKLAEHAEMLKDGRTVMKPRYNHSTGKIDPPVPFKPKRVVILEGLLPFHTRRLRELMDFSIYIDPDPEVKRLWKIKRDVQERGHSKEAVLKSIAEREPHYRRFIAPQRRYAEIVVQIKAELAEERYQRGTPYWVRLIQRITGEKLTDIHLPLNLSRMCRSEGEELYFEYRKGKRGRTPVSKIEINGMIPREMITEVEGRIANLAGRPGAKVLPRSERMVTEIGIAKLVIAWRVVERISPQDHKPNL